MFDADVEKTVLSLSKFTASWLGDAIDEHGVIRHLNSQGTKPPIVWIFNAAKEPENFARAFGLDQPIIALRSLNIIAKQSPDRAALSKKLSLYYASVLSDFLPSLISLIGGNCQGAPFAMWISNYLVENGHRIRGAATIDAAPTIDINLPVLLNFGSKPPERNPFLKDRAKAEHLYSSHYASYEVKSLPCGHGHYFDRENVGHLISNLNDFLSRIERPQDTQISL